MRSAPTDAERAVWHLVRDRQIAGFRFRRQYPIGRYILDFVCIEQRVIVEVDGAHHAEQVAYDRARDHFFRRQGFRVLRFTDREALLERDGVREAILQALSCPPPQPSPMKGEGVGQGSDDRRVTP